MKAMLVFILLGLAFFAHAQQSIQLTDAAKYYKSLPHQVQAWNWLQTQIQASTLSTFTNQYRAGVASTIPIKMVNAVEYYKEISYQVSAFNWLHQSQLPTTTLSTFAQISSS
jgi:hypothetical protein